MNRSYWQSRAGLRYYQVVRDWMPHHGRSIVDIGAGPTPPVTWGAFDRRIVIDPRPAEEIDRCVSIGRASGGDPITPRGPAHGDAGASGPLPVRWAGDGWRWDPAGDVTWHARDGADLPRILGGERATVILALQILEHLEGDAPAELARLMLRCGETVIASVPDSWPAGMCRYHPQDPVTAEKLAGWFGREPDRIERIVEAGEPTTPRLVGLWRSV